MLFLIPPVCRTFYSISFLSFLHLLSHSVSLFLFFLSFSNFSLSYFQTASFWFDDEGAVGDNARGSDPSHDRYYPPPMFMIRYIEQYDDRLDGQRFLRRVLQATYAKIGHVGTGCMSDTAVDVYILRWRHWGVCGATDLFCHFRQMKSPYCLCFEKVWYKRHLGNDLWRLGDSPILNWHGDPEKIIGFSSP